MASGFHFAVPDSTKWLMFLSGFLTLRINQKQAISKSLPIIIIIRKSVSSLTSVKK